MNLPAPFQRLVSPESLRKLLWLLLLALLWSVTLLIIPKVATQRPAIDSKLLVLRVFASIILLVAGASWKTLVYKRTRFIDAVLLIPLFIFVLTTLFSSNFLYSVTEAWQFGALISIAWIIYRLAPTAAECRTLLWSAGVLGLLASLYGFLSYIGADVLRSLYPFDFDETQAGGRNYIHSFFGNPEYFGGFAAPTAVVLWGLAFQPFLRIYHRILFVIAMTFVLLVLGLSGSRGAFLGFFVGASVVFVAQLSFLPKIYRRFLGIASVAAVVGLAVVLAILSVPNPLNPRDMRLFQRFTTLTDTQTASIRERVLFYTSTASAISENPVLGSGPGTYRLEFLKNVKRLVENDERAGTTIMLQELDRRLAEHAHNDYLEIWFEQGTLGIGAFLLLITFGGVSFVTVRFRLQRHLRAASVADLASAGMYVTTFAAVTTICVNALTSFPLHMPARATLAWLLVGVFFALDDRIREAVAERSGTKARNLPTTKVEN